MNRIHQMWHKSIADFFCILLQDYGRISELGNKNILGNWYSHEAEEISYFQAQWIALCLLRIVKIIKSGMMYM